MARKKSLKVKEDWQKKADATSFRSKRPVYGKRKDVTFPVSLAEKLSDAAKLDGVSQNRLIVEAVAEKLGLDLEE